MIQPRIQVIGLGVSGLTTIHALLENGFTNISVVTKTVSPETTSDKAAAIWHPFLAEPIEKTIPWSKASYDKFTILAKQAPNSGVRKESCREVFRESVENPPWASFVQGFHRLQDLPSDYSDGYVFQTFIANMERYMPWLMEKIHQAKIPIHHQSILNIEETSQSYDVIINTTGIGSRELFADSGVQAIKGQVILAEVPQLNDSFLDTLDKDQLCYFLRRDDQKNLYVIGGTAEAEPTNDQTSPEIQKAIWQRAKALVPDLREDLIRGTWAGFRPAHSQGVQVRAENYRGKLILHNYGHGGSGITLSWGCAYELVSLLQQHIDKKNGD